MRPACNRDPPAPSPRSKCSTSFAATRTHMGDHETRPTCHQVARLFGCWTAAPHASSVKAGPTEPQFRLWRTDPCSVGADVIRERLRLRGRESPLLRHSFRRIPTTRMPDGGGSLRAGRVGRGRREAIARRMPPGSSGSACASPGPSSHRPAPARRLRPWHSSDAVTSRRAIASMKQQSERGRVQDRSACSLPVSTASSRDYVWSPKRKPWRAGVDVQSDHPAAREFSCSQRRLRAARGRRSTARSRHDALAPTRLRPARREAMASSWRSAACPPER